MTEFNDYEPEDAWDTLDPIPVQLVNIHRRLLILEQSRVQAVFPKPGDSSDEQLESLIFRLFFFREHRQALNARAQLRIDQITDDLEYIRDRLDGAVTP